MHRALAINHRSGIQGGADFRLTFGVGLLGVCYDRWQLTVITDWTIFRIRRKIELRPMLGSPSDLICLDWPNCR